MDKRLRFEYRDPLGEPTVMPITGRHTWGGGLQKMASQVNVYPEVLRFIESLPEVDEEKHARALITALSAAEAFGPNVNGDGFHEPHLLAVVDYNGLPNLPRPIGDDWDGRCSMFKSFEHFARPYQHHINKPDSPAYGNVLGAFYHPRMRRVELVTQYDRDKAPNICRRLDNAEDVETSMGFRCLPFDVCSICGNRARSRKEYCDHLKNSMLEVLPSGLLAYAINPPPGLFFDISVVGRGADRTSRAVLVRRLPRGMNEPCGDREPVPMEEAQLPVVEESSDLSKAASTCRVKTAYAGQFCGVSGAEAAEQEETLRKEAARPVVKVGDIVKRFRSPAVVSMPPERLEALRSMLKRLRAWREDNRLPKEVLKKAGAVGPEAAVATLSVLGVGLLPSEAQYMMLEPDAPKLAAQMYDSGQLVALTRDQLGINDLSDEETAWIKAASIDALRVDRRLLEELKDHPAIHRRSEHRYALGKRLCKEGAPRIGERPLVQASQLNAKAPAPTILGASPGMEDDPRAEEKGILRRVLEPFIKPTQPPEGGVVSHAHIARKAALLAGFYMAANFVMEQKRFKVLEELGPSLVGLMAPAAIGASAGMEAQQHRDLFREPMRDYLRQRGGGGSNLSDLGTFPMRSAMTTPVSFGASEARREPMLEYQGGLLSPQPGLTHLDYAVGGTPGLDALARAQQSALAPERLMQGVKLSADGLSPADLTDLYGPDGIDLWAVKMFA